MCLSSCFQIETRNMFNLNPPEVFGPTKPTKVVSKKITLKLKYCNIKYSTRDVSGIKNDPHVFFIYCICYVTKVVSEMIIYLIHIE